MQPHEHHIASPHRRIALAAGIAYVQPRSAGRRQRQALQRMSGHASAAITLDIHADLFGDDLDAFGDAPSW